MTFHCCHLQAFDRLIGDIVAAERSRMNAGTMEVTAPGRDKMIFVGQGSQLALDIWRVLTIVGLKAYHTNFAESGQPFM